MSVTALDFPDRHFTVVTCLEVLEHLAEDQLATAWPSCAACAAARCWSRSRSGEPVPLGKISPPPLRRDRLLELFPHADHFILIKRDL